MSTHNNNCDPCAPIPTLPAAPPPTCGASSTPADCEEFISTDCVISAGNYACTEVYDPAVGSNITVGLTLGTSSTLSDLMEQLTGQACTTSVPMIGAILQKIGRTGELRDIFCQLVCQCVAVNCAGGEDYTPCDTAVQQIVFTNITLTGFSLTFYRIPSYTYTIRIYDTNTLPPVFYTRTIAAQGTSTVGANYTVASSTFPNATTLPSGHTFEVEITTTTVADGDCVSQTFTVITAQESGGNGGDPPACTCSQGTLSIVQGNTNNTPGLLAISIKNNGGFITNPIKYQIIVNNDLLPLINETIPAQSPNLANTITNYTKSGIQAGTYDVRVVPICSEDPLCVGGNFYGRTTVSAATPSCAAPDITGITIS